MVFSGPRNATFSLEICPLDLFFPQLHGSVPLTSVRVITKGQTIIRCVLDYLYVRVWNITIFFKLGFSSFDYNLVLIFVISGENIHLKILVPSIAAGAIIGKGGETIAQVQKDAGARVKMSKANDFYPGMWPFLLACEQTIQLPSLYIAGIFCVLGCHKPFHIFILSFFHSFQWWKRPLMCS